MPKPIRESLEERKAQLVIRRMTGEFEWGDRVVVIDEGSSHCGETGEVMWSLKSGMVAVRLQPKAHNLFFLPRQLELIL